MYGEEYTTSGSQPTTFRFTGQRLDAGIQLYFYNARYFDHIVGRFVQADTVVPQPSNPQALNRYSYVLNNPLRYTDLTGHFEEDELLAWGISQDQINAWKQQADWWSLIRKAKLGDKLIAWYRVRQQGVNLFFHEYTDSGNRRRLGLEANADIFLNAEVSTLELTRRATVRESRMLERQTGSGEWEGIWDYYDTTWMGPPGQGLYFRPNRLDAKAILGDFTSLALASIAGYDPTRIGTSTVQTAGGGGNILSGKQTVEGASAGDWGRAATGALGLLPRGAVPSALLSLALDIGKAFEYERGY